MIPNFQNVKKNPKNHASVNMSNQHLDRFLSIILGHREGFRDFNSGSFVNLDLFERTISSISGILFDESHDIHTVDDLAKDNMATVQPGGFLHGDKKLRSICVFSSVGHGQPSSSVMLELEVLVIEALSVDGFTSGSIFSGEISSLEHEIFDDAMENRSAISFRFGSLSQLEEILDRLGNSLAKESDFDCSNRFTSNGHLKGDFMSHFGSISIGGFRFEGQKRKDQEGNATTYED